MIARACDSDPGRQGRPNEDACALPAPDVDETRFGTLLALADGTGGLPGGGEASQEAVRYLQSLYYSAPDLDNLPDRLRQSVEQVNALNRLAQRQLSPEMGHLTTLVAAVIHIDQIWVANVGDSRAYLVKGASRDLVQLTEDHSNHIRNVKVGLVSETDLASRDSGVITRAIGLQDDCQVDIYHYTWTPGDRLVLCSDGLSHLDPDAMISTTLETLPEKAAQDLVAKAVETDGSDNCSAVVAAWLLPDQAEMEPNGDGKASDPARPMPPDAIQEPRTSLPAESSPLPELKQRPGSRQFLLGVLVGGFSVGLLAILLIFGRMMNWF